MQQALMLFQALFGIGDDIAFIVLFKMQEIIMLLSCIGLWNDELNKIDVNNIFEMNKCSTSNQPWASSEFGGPCTLVLFWIGDWFWNSESFTVEQAIKEFFLTVFN